MKKDLWLAVAGIILAGVMGGCLGVAGIRYTDWRYWMLISVFFMYGAVKRAYGRCT